MTAIIDSADIPLAEGWNWYACPRNHTTYAARHNSDGSHSYLHHIILGNTSEVDHRDNDGLNNRRSNLRQCSNHGQNNANMRPRTSLYKGVARCCKKHWIARTKVNGKYFKVGAFPTAMEAAKAYDDFMVSRFGDFARLNFPRKDSAA